jgi:hypothetical protein
MASAPAKHMNDSTRLKLDATRMRGMRDAKHACLSVHAFILSVHAFMCVCVWCMAACVCLHAILYLCLSVCLSLCLSVCLSWCAAHPSASSSSASSPRARANRVRWSMTLNAYFTIDTTDYPRHAFLVTRNLRVGFARHIDLSRDACFWTALSLLMDLIINGGWDDIDWMDPKSWMDLQCHSFSQEACSSLFE